MKDNTHNSQTPHNSNLHFGLHGLMKGLSCEELVMKIFTIYLISLVLSTLTVAPLISYYFEIEFIKVLIVHTMAWIFIPLAILENCYLSPYTMTADGKMAIRVVREE